jgi:hypothetical protein
MDEADDRISVKLIELRYMGQMFARSLIYLLTNMRGSGV